MKSPFRSDVVIRRRISIDHTMDNIQKWDTRPGSIGFFSASGNRSWLTAHAQIPVVWIFEPKK